MTEVTREQLEPPSREQDLLPIDDFISLCKDRAIMCVIDEGALEPLERDVLLFPALRVRVPLHRLKKDLLKQGWLEVYSRERLVSYPARQEFTPWSELRGIEQPLYSRLQVYPLQQLYKMRMFYVNHDEPFGAPDSWERFHKRIALLYSPGVYLPLARWCVAEYYKVFNLLAEIERLQAHREKDMLKFEQRSRVDMAKRSKREITDDLRAHERYVDRALSTKAQSICAAHAFCLPDLERWRSTFLDLGTFRLEREEAGVRLRPYLDRITDTVLTQAEEPYRIAHLLNWLISVLGGAQTTLRALILGFRGHHCEICYRPFEPRDSRQITCGADPCVAEHRRRYKAGQRCLGYYR
jgi:hypothetical protein